MFEMPLRRPPKKPSAKTVALVLCLLMLGNCTSTEKPALDETLPSEVQSSLDLAEHYFTVTAFRDKGLFRYRYDPEENEYTQRNNELRQLMGARLLAELASRDSSLIAKHRKNLDFLFEFWMREEGDIAFIYYDDKSKLGANAMALRTLVHSPDFERHRLIAAKLANGILALQQPDGSLRPWLKEPPYAYDADYLMTFYSGEALLALVEYAEKLRDSPLIDLARLSQDYYIDKYVTHMDKNFYPAYVPWHSQSLSLLYKITGDRRYAEAVLTLNDQLLSLQDTSDHPGRFYDPARPEYGSPHASSDAVYTEGLAYGLEIARKLDDAERAERYSRSIESALRHLMRLQYAEDDISNFPEPARALGGLRTSDTDPRIRIDNVQHAMDAYIKALAIL